MILSKEIIRIITKNTIQQNEYFIEKKQSRFNLYQTNVTHIWKPVN